MRSHGLAKIGEFPCKECGKVFTTPRALGGHASRAHVVQAAPAPAPPAPPVPTSRAKHLKHPHLAVKIHCPLCDKRIARGSLLHHANAIHPLANVAELRRQAFEDAGIEYERTPRLSRPPRPSSLAMSTLPSAPPEPAIQIVHANGHRLTADEVCAEVLAAMQSTIPTAALPAVFAWRASTAVMLVALEAP